MNKFNCLIKSNKRINSSTFLLECVSSELANSIKPGQFCNIRVSESYIPLLRRPFSVSDVVDDKIYFMISIHGNGTKILSDKREGDFLDILGPLGNGFGFNENFSLAIFVAGGIGLAPFPYLTKFLSSNVEIKSFIGARNINELITEGMINYSIATDDGSVGFKGNVVELLEKEYNLFNKKDIKMFACGPTPMLKAVQQFCLLNNINCEISTESAMACGFGICQGCPIESTEVNKMLLICKDGPVFNVKDVKL
ncbi:MAG: dihydroorotate dehydrogenase electron transfer subunit [bacterium]